MDYRHFPYDKLHTLTIDEILIYLRKSRQDDPNETVEEVLLRHETQLQEYAQRTWGARIPEQNILREVVSGETIDDRPEMKKLLEQVQDTKTRAVLVIEPQRLTRGDLLDCGTVVHALRYTSTLCVTPTRFYDLEDKYSRREFEEELKRGGDFLEYIKEILDRGRRASAAMGYWVSPQVPFGYDRVQLKNKKYTLEENADAPLVRMIYEDYAAGKGPMTIANKLSDMGIPTPSGKMKFWHEKTVRQMLKNDAYIGIVTYGEMKTIKTYKDGRLQKVRIKAPEDQIIKAKGLHDPIIPADLWERVQGLMGRTSRAKGDVQKVDPLSGLMYCKRCGYAVGRTTSSSKGRKWSRYVCRLRSRCSVKSIAADEMIEGLIDALRGNVVEIEEKISSGAHTGREIKEAQLAALLDKMEALEEKEDYLYDLLEKKEYTPEVFNRRRAKLIKDMDATRAAIEKAKEEMPEVVDYQDALIRLHAAIDALDNDKITATEKNVVLKSIISKIVYDREKGPFDNPFELTVHLKL